MANTQNHRKVPHGLDYHLGSDLVDERFVTYIVHLLSLHSSPYRSVFFSLLCHIFFASVLLFIGRPCIISRVVLSQIVRPPQPSSRIFSHKRPSVILHYPNLKFCEPVFTSSLSLRQHGVCYILVDMSTNTDRTYRKFGIRRRCASPALLSCLEFHSCVAPGRPI